MAADNSAYDYFLHDNPHKPADAYDEPVYMPRMPAEEPEIIRAPKITMKKTPPKRGSASKVFLIALSAFSLAFIVLSSKVETNCIVRFQVQIRILRVCKVKMSVCNQSLKVK